MRLGGGATLEGRRVVLRPLRSDDFVEWRAVRERSASWLLKWEPRLPAGQPDPSQSSAAFAARCSARQREWQLGSGYGFGIFVGPRFAGEINLSGLQRGPFQNAYVGYWIGEEFAGNGYIPEALAVVTRFAFEDLKLHRIQVAIIPRNTNSRRVVEKLALREEGIAERYLEINGVWEDHVRYAITAEEWAEKADGYIKDWILPA